MNRAANADRFYGATRKLPPYRVLFVDPGVSGAGWAFWKVFERKRAKKVKSYVIPLDASLPWDERLVIGVEALLRTTLMMRVRHVVVEVPELWAGSARSFAAAEDGDTFKLSAFIGGLIYAFRSVRTRLYYVTPPQWKGQLDKHAVEKRIKRAIGLTVRSHAADAVGMGLSALRLL